MATFKGTYDSVYLASSEWGSELMARIAREYFEEHPGVEFVEVHEHGGWWLGYRRDGSIWSTANDAANLAAGARPEQWSGVEVRRTNPPVETCKIQWIVPEKGDVPTPDSNPAVGYAIAFVNPDTAFPICREHLKRVPHEGWLFLPLPETTPVVLAARLSEVKVVVDAIKKAFDNPDKDGKACWANILPTLRAARDHYSFNKWGMYVGVEPDGYIHT